MELLINQNEAIKLLKERISDVYAVDFIPKVWKDRTVLDLKQIFGQLSEQWLQISGINFETFISSEKEAVLKEGKETAVQLLNSYINFIERHSEIKHQENQIREDKYKKQYRELLTEWNEFVPQYNALSKEHEAISSYNNSLENKISELEIQITETRLSEEFINFEIIDGTRGYLENVAKQAILCYQNGLFDACLVMSRKLLETLIIECFEKHRITETIKNGAGNFLYLNDLITEFINQDKWSTSRNTKQSLPRVKKFADLSAHNRRFNAKKGDIDQIKDDLRIIIEELVHIADLKVKK